MLGNSYFDLAQKVYRANSFTDLVDLLVAKLPALVGAEEVVVVETSPHKGVCGIWNQGPIARRLGERIEKVNRLRGSHPLQLKVDLKNPEYLGFVMSDHLSPEDFGNCEFVRELYDGIKIGDVLFGMLVNGKCRQAHLNCYISEGHFTTQARECFDALLLTLRGVMDRLESRNTETRVRERLFVMRTDAPLALFVLNPQGEAMPLNHGAVKLSESWWSRDEAFRQLSAEQLEMIQREASEAWDNAVTARWIDIDLDLGGGVMSAHLLPKLNCEGILMFSMGSGEDAAEALRGVLTRRQIEIMDWISEGKTSAEVAIILDISPRTVEKHLEAVFQRLGVENRIAAVRRYLDFKVGHVL